MELTDFQRNMIRSAVAFNERRLTLARVGGSAAQTRQAVLDASGEPVVGLNYLDRVQAEQAITEFFQLVARNYLHNQVGDNESFHLTPAGVQLARELGYLPAN